MADDEVTKQLLAKVSPDLSALPNVVGVGVVQADDAPAQSKIAVYVSAKLPESALKPEDVVPQTVKGEVGGVSVQAPTTVIEVGKFKL